ncbi:MAG: hypothetical protein KDA65_08285 [Planctomycetaceae bacterium]|nr:hypothetical protein [Planctomycetaceae bacterium]
MTDPSSLLQIEPENEIELGFRLDRDRINFTKNHELQYECRVLDDWKYQIRCHQTNTKLRSEPVMKEFYRLPGFLNRFKTYAQIPYAPRELVFYREEEEFFRLDYGPPVPGRLSYQQNEYPLTGGYLSDLQVEGFFRYSPMRLLWGTKPAQLEIISGEPDWQLIAVAVSLHKWVLEVNSD